VNRATLTLGLVLMDVAWVYPWSALLGTWADPPRDNGLLSSPTILALLLLSAIATHLIGRRLGRARPAKLTLAALALIAAVAAVRVEHYSAVGGVDWVGPLLGALATAIGELSGPVVAFAVALYLWYRGVRLGSQTPSFTDVESAFRWGIGRLAVFGLVVALSRRLEAQTTPYVVAFFFVSLLTLALGRLESLRTRTRTPSLNTQWLAVLLVVASSVVLLALLLGQIVSFDLLVLATRPLFDVLGSIVLLLLYIIVIPLAFVLEWLIYLVLSLIQGNGNRLPPEPLSPSDLDNALQRFLAEQMPPELVFGLKAAGAALLVIIALAIVVRGLSRWRPTGADADATNEERDSLWDPHQAWALFLAWLRGLFGRRGQMAALPSPTAAVLAGDSLPTRLDSVRALYGELLRAGAAAGAVRRPATTPLEHQRALREVLEPDEAIAELTVAYVAVRYGDMDVPIAEVRERFDEVRSKGADDSTSSAYS
jgi:Domain of unknown function (DUF4129)